ncbi:OLC1v1026591C1 [Oldenlandia corymbosa var. corymbosa]|uniref:Exocyst subunit Exo70 family protein n=1 Tax=Oldenlandia corymbosa var. corymbosa TaxID=529605 RepID=A0AAV1C7V0_OLDCO|nr:OLC1v1026591C1 [Oldenlandia corymbosa var. corymbosa]
MALVELPTTPKRAISRIFAPSNTSSPMSSLSNHFPTPPSTSSSRTMSESMMDENMEVAGAMITKWDVQGSTVEKFTSLFHENRKEAKEFIKCVNDLRRAMHFFVSQRSAASSKLVPAQNLMKMAMQRLEHEFYQILSANKAYLDPESVSSHSSRLSSTSNDEIEDFSSDNEIQRVGEAISEVERLSVLAMSDLRMIADCMIRSGYSKECINIYKLIRKSIVDEGLYRLGIERYSSSQISKMNASDLERQIKTWLRGVKIAVKTLLHGERLLCDYVFSTSETIRESCFANIAKEGATNLFRFPELVVKSKRLPEKVYLLMDLHEALSDVYPEIESVFSNQSVSSVKLQALSSIHKLGDAVQSIIAEFESSVQKNSSRFLVPGGAIHPLTISVMDYVSKLANYSGVLSGIIGDSTSATQLQFPESYFESPVANDTPTSAVSVRLAWIILVLLCKLDTKAEYYNDIALTYLFLANNLRFVLEKVHNTALKFILGNDWMAKLERKIKVFAINYEMMAWGNVLGCLPENSQDEMSPDTVKAYFRSFNAALDEAYRKQVSWVVPDRKLRDEIKLSIARKLVPAYAEFYNIHIETLKGESSLEVLVRFSPDNLGNYLSDILHGTDVSESSSPSSSSRAIRCLI